MFRKIIENFKSRQLARQLRKPVGTTGRKVGNMMNHANGFLYNRTIEIMELRDGHYILEIGFGNGKMFSKLIDTNLSIQISGIDYSVEMVKEATSANEKFIRENRVSLYTGSSDQLPFGDESFDKVFCINVAYFWDHPALHLKEIYRVLKPGGIFYATIRSKESMEMMPFTKFAFTMYTPEGWESLVKKNKFELLKIEELHEPSVDFKGNSYEIMSFCMVNKKATL